MRLLLRLLAVIVVLVAVVAAGGLTYLYARYPDVPPPSESFVVKSTPELVERGAYLANHVAICMDCHTERDYSKYAGPIRHDRLGAGGEKFDRFNAGIPGTLYAKNVTPFALGSWSDGELLRAVVSGVSKDGTPLFPLMPYINYGTLAEDDIHAILAYVRTLAPVESHQPARSLEVPLNLIVRTIPTEPHFGSRPPASDKVAYGEYMTRAAACAECHTPRDNGELRQDIAFAGGNEFRHPELGYRVRSANITADADTGIGTWTEQQFVDKFKSFETPDDRVLKDAEQRQNTAMPWRMYAGMTREDLAAIYAFLRSQKPVINRVEKWPDSVGLQ
jgi:mono/diheme cytochrome c family protein